MDPIKPIELPAEITKAKILKAKCEEVDLSQITTYGQLHLSKAEIAGMLGIAPVTFYKWCEERPEIKEALEKGRSMTILGVSNALIKEALAGDVRAGVEFLKVNSQKWRGALSGMEAGEGIGAQNNQMPDIPHDVKLRMAATFLRQNGWVCYKPEEQTIEVEPTRAT